ncbi:MAG: acetyl-CoA carboxylase biotin carboxylase subunit [Chloroflexi bacterium]|nr:acetyl-CoA carboxylase biotin carboxylase subunit [Chloroflexota bacterium]
MRPSAPFKRVLIANRGEIAVRIIRACREMGIIAAAVYSDADRDALHVQLADEIYPLGPSSPEESYLNAEKVLAIARRAGADAIHPGYGFLSENPAFADACSAQGIVFIGPSADNLRSVGNKVAARQVAQETGVPIVPGSVANLNGRGEAAAIARAVGYPVLLKAAAGGGGKGMRIAHNEEVLEHAISEAAGEARRAFGNPSIYVEKLVRAPRHIEVQLLADNYGNIVHLGERDCSIQRRYQKIVEESPSPGVDAEMRQRITEAAIRMARGVSYRNIGTVEFLVDGSNFYFLEVNPRLQVEHPVTEFVTSVDIVKEQILIAAGERLRLRQEDIVSRGHSIQCRIYAENPFENFIPASGVVQAIRHPGGPSVRIDSGVQDGSSIPMEYDGLLSKVVVWGKDRDEAIARMSRALDEYKILGVFTTIPFKRFVVKTDLFASGRFDTHFISNVWADWIKHAKAMGMIPSPVAETATDIRPVTAGSPLSRREEMAPWRVMGMFSAVRR